MKSGHQPKAKENEGKNPPTGDSNVTPPYARTLLEMMLKIFGSEEE